MALKTKKISSILFVIYPVALLQTINGNLNTQLLLHYSRHFRTYVTAYRGNRAMTNTAHILLEYRL